MRKYLMAMIAIVVTVAGCGGGTKTVTIPSPQKVVVHGRVCDPKHFTMQCGLADQVPPAPQLFSAPFGIQQGVDFTNAPACSSIRAAGFRFGASYISFDSWKNWTTSAIFDYHRHGCNTVDVWETTATRAAGGFSAGVADAHSAYGQARAHGNTVESIPFAIDFDATGPQVASYFHGVHSVLGNRGNAYGGYFPLQYLCANHLVGHLNWQTYAWSGGRWLPSSCAPLEQWSNNHVVAGHSVDYDRALLPNYGQYPFVAPKPPDPFGYLDKTRRHLVIPAYSPVWGAPRTVIAAEYNTVKRYRTMHCRKPERRVACTSSLFHDRLLEARLFVVAHRYHRHHLWDQGRGRRLRTLRIIDKGH